MRSDLVVRGRALFFFFQAEDGIRDDLVTGVQTCALPIFDALASCADQVVAAEVPEPFLAIGQWYRDFAQTDDAEVVELLRLSGKAQGDGKAAASAAGAAPAAGAAAAAADRDGIVMTGPVPLPGRLTVPAGARGVVG